MADHKTLKGLGGDSPLLAVLGAVAIAVFVAVVTLGRLVLPYGDFRGEAFSRGGTIVLLVVLNILVMGAVIAFLVFLLKPPNWFVRGGCGAELPRRGHKSNCSLDDHWDRDPRQTRERQVVGHLGPVGELAQGRDRGAVKKAKAREIKAVVKRYQDRDTAAGRTQLIDRLDESLSAEGVPEQELAKLKEDVKAILETKATPYPQLLRQVTRRLYDLDHRGAVQTWPVHGAISSSSTGGPKSL